MCDLLGLSFNVPISARISLDVFQQRGKPNPDGWGVAYYNASSLQVVKEPMPATTSPLFDFVENHTTSKTYVSHVRRTTRGIKSYLNTHPFYRRIHVGGLRQEWVFAHNGTLETVQKLKLRHNRPLGETDSEHAFCYILDTIMDWKISEWNDDNLSFLNEALCDINDSVNTFNCMFADGTHLFCYCDENRHNDGLRYVERSHPFGVVDLTKRDQQIGSVEIHSTNLDEVKTKEQTGFIIVTEELTDENWVEIQAGSLVVFKNGRIIS